MESQFGGGPKGDFKDAVFDHLRGGAHEPLSRAAIEAKFAANAAFGGWSTGQIDPY